MQTTKTNDISGGTVVLGIIALIAFGVLILILASWGFSFAWGEFIVPVFGLPEITVAQGFWALIGAAILGMAFRGNPVRIRR